MALHDDDVARLLEIVENPPAHPPRPQWLRQSRKRFDREFPEWLKASGLHPPLPTGVQAHSATASDLFRHYEEYCDIMGYPPPPEPPPGVWGNALRAAGFKDRKKIIRKRVERVEILMDHESARRMRLWILDNPPPPIGEGPFKHPANRRRVRR